MICLDDFSTGNRNNIEHLLNHPRFTLVEHDVRNPYDPETPLDEIYNLACPASPIHYQNNPVKTVLTNVLGSIYALELAKKYHAKIFQASTSEIYGDPLEHPQKEEYWGNVNPIGPRSCYDEGKRSAETLFFDYYRQFGVKIKVARIFNTFGPRMAVNDGRVVSNFIVQALKGEDLTLYGNGLQTRSFCYYSDLIAGIRALMQTPDSFTGPVNLGNPTENTILDIALATLKLTESKSKLLILPLPQDDPKKRCPDITLAKDKLQWQPVVDLETGLTKTIDYFKSIL